VLRALVWAGLAKSTLLYQHTHAHTTQIKLFYHFCSLSSLLSTGNKRTKRMRDKPGSLCALIKVSVSFDGAVSVGKGGCTEIKVEV